MDLSGIFPALTTPYAPDGSVSLASLKHNIQKYNATDLAGYVVLGSTGETVLLSSLEMDSVLATVKEAAAKNKRLIAGTGAESTAETIERTKRAASLGYEIALVKTPHYYKPAYKPHVLVEHYRRVADASPIPVLLYSVPQFTGVTLEAAEVAILASHPNIMGIKDSSGDVRRVAEMVTGTPGEFQVLVGSAATVFPSFVIGARGAILALASTLPEKCAELFRLYQARHLEKARQLHDSLVNYSKLIVSELGIAGVKFAMDQRGFHGGIPRPPLPPLPQEQKKRIMELLLNLDPIPVPV